MGPFEAVVFIVIVVTVAGVIKNKQEMKYGKNGEHHQPDSQQTKELQLEIMAMKKRIEALEAIVTDKNYDLGREIDRL